MAETHLAEHTGFGLAAVLPHRASAPQAIGAALGLALVAGPHVSAGDDLALIGIGPRQWLAYAAQAADDWAEALAARLGEAAAVVDQSGGFRLFALSGAGARAKLQQGLSIDLDPAVLPANAALVSQIAHIGVVVWPREAGWIVAVPRSFAHDLHDWLASA
ncbi:sarcosine oxidase subunit gamma [Novosphingobium sp. Chol11]|uniref:sarcosine oxidase subunit gamma n=1 Tax=Novosphingobium sp. Chol11 TaxID=1385763 RepID=UPI0025F09C88|nr:sarcosine oxidase subunit gamma family protein [Novosphingobium sp. Chol11]